MNSDTHERGSDREEYGLIDFWLILVRRRRLVWTTLMLVVLTGLIVQFLLPEEYEFTTSVELAKVQVGNRLVPVEEIETAKEKLVTAFIPEFRITRELADPEAPPIDMSVLVPQRTDLLVLRSRGDESEEEAHLEAHRSVLERLVVDHSRTTDVVRSELEAKLDQVRVELDFLREPSTLEAERKVLETRLHSTEAEIDYLRDPVRIQADVKELEVHRDEARLTVASLDEETRFINAELARLDEKRRLLESERSQLQQELAELASQETSSESATVTSDRSSTIEDRLSELKWQLLLDIQGRSEQQLKALDNNRRRRQILVETASENEAKLERLPLERAREEQKRAAELLETQELLRNLEFDHARRIARLESQERESESRLEAVYETRAVAQLRSPNPVSGSLRWVLALSVVGGLVLGCLVAMAAELRTAVQRRLD